MAPYGISTTKEFNFRGSPEQFSNVYHFDVPFAPTEGGFSDLVDAIVAIERPLFNSAIAFRSARVWGPTNGTEAESVTQLIKDLTGNGTMGASGATIPKESAIVVSFYLGRSSTTGRKRFLRKYFHSGQIPSSTTDSIRMGDAPLAAADKTPFVNAMGAMKNISVGGGVNHLCAPNGDHLPLNSTAVALNYTRIRQLKQ